MKRIKILDLAIAVLSGFITLWMLGRFIEATTMLDALKTLVLAAIGYQIFQSATKQLIDEDGSTTLTIDISEKENK
jgi:hypothetical protein